MSPNASARPSIDEKAASSLDVEAQPDGQHIHRTDSGIEKDNGG